jgi:hypothetical protein
MNKELNKLICDIDGKITAFRLSNHIEKRHMDLNDNRLLELIKIQHMLHELYDKNKKFKGIIKDA